MSSSVSLESLGELSPAQIFRVQNDFLWMRKFSRSRMKGKVEKLKCTEAMCSQFRNISLGVQEICGTTLSRQERKQHTHMVRYMHIHLNIFQKLEQTRLIETMNGNYSQHPGKTLWSRHYLNAVLNTVLLKHIHKCFSRSWLNYCHCPFKDTL